MRVVLRSGRAWRIADASAVRQATSETRPTIRGGLTAVKAFREASRTRTRGQTPNLFQLRVSRFGGLTPNVSLNVLWDQSLNRALYPVPGARLLEPPGPRLHEGMQRSRCDNSYARFRNKLDEIGIAGDERVGAGGVGEAQKEPVIFVAATRHAYGSALRWCRARRAASALPPLARPAHRLFHIALADAEGLHLLPHRVQSHRYLPRLLDAT